jgi:exopolysaccharide biosynthesis polyprenyl glycosylphosphotransferase
VARNSAAFNAVDEPITGLARPARSRRVRQLLGLLLILLDVTMLALAFVAAYLARGVLPFFSVPDVQPPFQVYLPTMLLHIGTIIVLFYASRLYHQRRVFSRFDQARSIVAVVTFGALLANGVQELAFRNTILEVSFPRSTFFYTWLFSLVLVPLGREVHRSLTIALRRRGLASDNLLVVGTGKIAVDIVKQVQRHRELGYNIVGVVNDPNSHQGKMMGVPVIGNYPDLPDLIDRYQVQQIIIAVPDARRSEIVELVTMCQRSDVDVKIYPDIFAYIAGDLNLDDLNGMPLLTVRDIALRGWKLSLKRGLDIVGAFFGLIILSPFMLLTAYLLQREDPGPVFFIQERMGLDGKPFPMIKFRSMRVDSEANGPGWTVENDPRVTRIGRFMRSTNWDEIPQLINVLLGHMSLVGPRPEQPHYVNQFRTQIPRYMERHREKAGMTGWAQIHGLRGDTSIPERTTYDLWYVENWSLWLDIKIIIRTIIQTITRQNKNAY